MPISESPFATCPSAVFCQCACAKREHSVGTRELGFRSLRDNATGHPSHVK